MFLIKSFLGGKRREEGKGEGGIDPENRSKEGPDSHLSLIPFFVKTPDTKISKNKKSSIQPENNS